MKKYSNNIIHLWLQKGNIYLDENAELIQLTEGYKIPYFKQLVNMKTRIYFECGKDKYFYFDKKDKYIYFLVNEDDITLLKSLIQQQDDKGEWCEKENNNYNFEYFARGGCVRRHCDHIQNYTTKENLFRRSRIRTSSLPPV